MGFVDTSGTIHQNDCFRSLSGCRHRDVQAAASPLQTRIPTDSCSFCRNSLPGAPSTWASPDRPRAVLSDENRQPSRFRSRPPLRDGPKPLAEPPIVATRHREPASHATGTRPVKVATLGIRRCPPCGSASRLAAASRTSHRADPRSFEWEITTLLCFTSPFPTLPSSPPKASLRETIGCLSWDFPKIAPPPDPLPKSPLPRVTSLPPASGEGEPPPPPRSVSVVLRHLDGFRLFDPARLLHRATDHGVRGVSNGLRSRLPTTRSRPSKSSPPSRQLPVHSRARVAGLASPARRRAVHRQTFPPRPLRASSHHIAAARRMTTLNLEGFLQEGIRCRGLRFRKDGLVTPLGLLSFSRYRLRGPVGKSR